MIECLQTTKRKKIILTIEQKLQNLIIALLYIIMESIGSPLEEQKSFKQKMTEMGMNNVKAKVMKVGIRWNHCTFG